MPHRVFLLSPASSAGKRCEQLVAHGAGFELAVRLRDGGAPIGEVFSFLSSLYFRGKLTYSQRFAAPPEACPGVLVITAGRGLVSPETPITLRDLRAFSRVAIDTGDRRYVEPLRDHAHGLREQLPPGTGIVLLGSIATPKYVEILGGIFGRSLLFPAEFVGRGDMSRGGLLLRAARDGVELGYRPIDGAERRGQRPAKLPPLPRVSARSA